MNKLHILWTTDNLDTVKNMVFMYATNSMLYGWWDEVTVVIWGASAKLAAENEDVWQLMEMAVHAGVKFSACRACAGKLGIREQLESLGVEVISWGPPLTEIIQTKGNLITI